MQTSLTKSIHSYSIGFFIRNKDLGLNPKVKKNLVKSQLCVNAALLLRSIKLIRYSSENIRVVAVARVECNKCSKLPVQPVQPSRSSLSFLSCFTIADVVLLAQPFAAGAKVAETFHLPPVIKQQYMYFSNSAILTCMLIGKNNPCFDVFLLRIFIIYHYFLLEASGISATAFQEPFSMNLCYGTKHYQGSIKDLLRLSAKQICRQLEVGKHALNLQARGRNRHFLSRLVPKFERRPSLDCLERKICKFIKT